MRCPIDGNLFCGEHEECVSCGQYYEKSDCKYAFICNECCKASCKCTAPDEEEE